MKRLFKYENKFKLFVLLFILGARLHGQDTTFVFPDLDLPCAIPKIDAQSIIKTSSESKVVYLKFQEDIPDFFVISSQLGNEVTVTELSANELAFELNNPDDEIEVALVNTCNEIIQVTLNTNSSESSNKDFIEVSPTMGDLLQAYIEEKDTPLLDFLANDESVGFFEKLSFYQSYGLKGEKIDFDFSNYKTDLTDLDSKEDEIWNLLKTNRGEITSRDDECFCDFISIGRTHSDFVQIGGHPEHWYEYQRQAIIDDTPVETVQDRGEYWKDLYALGASKWLGIWTQGLNTSKQHGVERSHESGDTAQVNSGKRGTISVLLLCMDGNDLPASCSCDKDGTFIYRYDTHLHTATVLGSGTAQHKKRAIAAASDMVVAFCYFGNRHADGLNVDNFLPIEGLNLSVSAECKGELNPDFWPAIEGFLGQAIDVATTDAGQLYKWKYEYRYDSTLIHIDTLQNPPLILDTIYRIDTILIDSSKVFHITTNSEEYKKLLHGFINVITTPYLQEYDCSGGDADGTMKANDFHFTLKPNIKATFVVMTYAKVMAGGRRSWQSHAGIASEYSMAVVVRPGKTSGKEEDCCTPHVAGYLIGAPFITNDWDHLNYDMGEMLHTEGFSEGYPNGLGVLLGGYLVRGQKGQMSMPPFHGECHVPLHTRSSFIHDDLEESMEYSNNSQFISEDVSTSLKDGGDISVFDVNGRYLGGFQLQKFSLNPLNNIKTEIKRLLLGKTYFGVYFVRIEKNDKKSFIKILLD